MRLRKHPHRLQACASPHFNDDDENDENDDDDDDNEFEADDYDERREQARKYIDSSLWISFSAVYSFLT